MQRRRFRTWAKWACTLAGLLALGAAVFSWFATAEYAYRASNSTTAWQFSIESGLVRLIEVRRHDRISFIPLGWTVRAERVVWSWGWHDPNKAWLAHWHAGFLWYRPDIQVGDPGIRSVGVSLLYPVLLTSIPAALLWYADRRRYGPGRCVKCGYDRRGLAADGKCPECGTVAAPAS